jgi:hypothetical protein
MTQALYAHMNNKIKKKKTEILLLSQQRGKLGAETRPSFSP